MTSEGYSLPSSHKHLSCICIKAVHILSRSPFTWSLNLILGHPIWPLFPCMKLSMLFLLLSICIAWPNHSYLDFHYINYLILSMPDVGWYKINFFTKWFSLMWELQQIKLLHLLEWGLPMYKSKFTSIKDENFMESWWIWEPASNIPQREVSIWYYVNVCPTECLWN